jgi:sulfide dehydrogenase [flavocytochrome c] flavoprotein chain
MSKQQPTRPTFLARAADAACSAGAFHLALAQRAARRVVGIGGGFAGATCARTLKHLDPRLVVTLVEPSTTYTACPFNHEVIGGIRELRDQEFTYDKLAGNGIELAKLAVTGIDPQAHAVTTSEGTRISYDRLVLAPAIDLCWDALPGYCAAAAERMPHA